MIIGWIKKHSHKWRSYIATILIVVSLGMLIQMLSFPYTKITEGGRLLYLGVWTAILLSMVGYAKRYIFWLVIYAAIFVSAGYVPLFDGEKVYGKEIASAYLFGVSWFLFWTWFYGAVQKTASNVIRRLICALSYAALVVSTFMPLFVWGYWIVSGGYVISSSILLTLFQTNLDEALAYLNNQNAFLWILGLLGLFLAIAGVVKILRNALQVEVQLPGRCEVLFWIVFTVIGMFVVNKDLYEYRPYHIGMEVKDVLQGYRAYGEARAMREARLKDLHDLKIVSQGGVFVLVIGESETRNHMQIYGYDRETTPWLQEQRKNKENIIFFNAYSNHTHTVPVLTYALSEKNQYNEIDLKNAYSLIEIANAAGYETYWISNQRKFGVWDTPVGAIGSAALYQKWMNNRIGRGVETDYYDDILLSQIPTECAKDALIVIHLMGCHVAYGDRYPHTDAYFLGTEPSVDEYDNTVRYNDYILSKIYERVRSLPNFKGMIYFSDHGEDPDRGLGHESSKFTWPMARIPLVMWLSDEFQTERPQAFTYLKAHEQAYWTNDLVYDVMIDLLSIEGVPHRDLQYDLASENYKIAKETAMTLHGSVKLADEKMQEGR